MRDRRLDASGTPLLSAQLAVRPVTRSQLAPLRPSLLPAPRRSPEQSRFGGLRPAGVQRLADGGMPDQYRIDDQSSPDTQAYPINDAGLCERMVWVIEKFSPVTDERELEIVVDALLFRFVGRLVGMPPDLREVQDHLLTPSAVLRLAQRLDLFLDPDDQHTLTSVRYDPGWDGVFVETWLLRSSRRGVVYTERYLDDVVHQHVQSLLGAPTEARFDTWRLDGDMLRRLTELLELDLDVSWPEYYLSYLRTECLPPPEVCDWSNLPCE